MAYREFRVDGCVVDVAGDVLDLRVVLALARNRRGSALEGRHGGEGRGSDSASGDWGRRGGSESNWPDSSADDGGALTESSGCSTAQVATEGRHCQISFCWAPATSMQL
jgi:hypothetical protein